MIRRIGRTYTRLVALLSMLIGFLLLSNLLNPSGWEPEILAWIVASGVAALSGGVLALLWMDGPPRFKSRKVGILGWLAMLGGAVGPYLFAPFVAGAVMLTAPVLWSHSPVTSK